MKRHTEGLNECFFNELELNYDIYLSGFYAFHLMAHRDNNNICIEHWVDESHCFSYKNHVALATLRPHSSI